MKKPENYILHVPEYFGFVWGNIEDCIVEIMAGNYPVEAVFEERSFSTLKRGAPADKWVVTWATDIPNEIESTGDALAWLNETLQDEFEDGTLQDVKNYFFIGKQLPPKEADKVVKDLFSKVEKKVRKQKEQEKKQRRRLFWELYEEFKDEL